MKIFCDWLAKSSHNKQHDNDVNQARYSSNPTQREKTADRAKHQQGANNEAWDQDDVWQARNSIHKIVYDIQSYAPFSKPYIAIEFVRIEAPHGRFFG